VSGGVRVVVEADGGARGNPGPAGWGAVVRDADTGRVLRERAEPIGTATNNVAEYGGLIAGLREAADLGATEVEVRMDSKLVIEQMSGRWKIRHPGLRPLAARAAELAGRFERVTWRWVPRERNRDADRLANQAMDLAERGLGKAGPPPAGAEPAPGVAPAGPAAEADAAAGPVEPATGAGPAAAGVAGPQRVVAPGAGWAPPTGVPTRLVLVRHGATGHTAERRWSGRGDVPLSPEGRAQAEAVARRVARLAPRVAAVVTSPLTRCVDTAAAIAARTGDPPVVTDADLVECDFGQWEGLTVEEIARRWPSDLAAWQRSTAVAPPGGESLRRVATRVRRAVTRLRTAYPGETVVVVSHVTPLKLMLRDALAAGDGLLHRLFLDPGGISVVDSYPDGVVAVRAVNDTAHLSGGASAGGAAQS
jgi:broad specificity phosphatase PhoE/ribonuclease HI